MISPPKSPRDPQRIPRILEKLALLWEKNPDLRLGQLIENLYRLSPNRPQDIFYLEDEDLEKVLDSEAPKKPSPKTVGWKLKPKDPIVASNQSLESL